MNRPPRFLRPPRSRTHPLRFLRSLSRFLRPPPRPLCPRKRRRQNAPPRFLRPLPRPPPRPLRPPLSPSRRR
ncbi:MAG: hypothetical protein DCC52_13480 [Chloroflexi bacterium]|nr:MAG: hypothetical protein DCC52_13480 [Chloroflexota bacterium]